MDTAKIFTNGGSQAVRLPKDCRFDDNEVYINHIGNVVMLVPKSDPWGSFIMGLNMFTEDFLQDGIDDLPVREIEKI